MAEEKKHKHRVGDEVKVKHESPHTKNHTKAKVVSSHYGPYYGLKHPHGGVVYMPAAHVDSSPPSGDPAPPNAEPTGGATGTGPHASDDTSTLLEFVIELLGRNFKL